MKIVNYTANAGFGIIFPAKTFIKEFDNDIYIISPGDLSDSDINELRNSNKALHFIAPNSFHNLYLKKMHKQFPGASFYGPKRAQEQSRIKLDRSENIPTHDLSVFPINGIPALKESFFYFKKSKELVITDLVFNMHHKMNLATKLAMKLAGTYHKLGTSRLVKSSIKDKQEVLNSLAMIKELEVEKVYLNHGDNISFQELKIHLESL